MSTLVLSLSGRRACDPSVSGGKGSSLARLTRGGFPVPPGFVITTAAFREPLYEGSRLPDLEAARRFCLSWPVPGHLRRAILRARRRLGPGPVAVRSSLVGEDSGEASFAGQLDTVLDVEGDDALLEAVRRVLASAFGDRLWAYLRQTAPAASSSAVAAFPSLSLAVVVQSMVRAEVSGVAFSADPVTGQNDVVIEAVPGLGEDLVRGRVSPDRYRIDPRGALTASTRAGAAAPLLSGADVRALAGTVRDIAARAGSPQDVEWSRDAAGFRVLQARPIASLAGLRLYSRKLVSDMAPGLVRPLVWSTKYRSMVKNVLAPTFQAVLKAPDLDYTRLIVRYYSRVYTDMTLVGESFARLGFPVNVLDVMHREEKAERKRVPPRLRMVPGFFRLARLARRVFRMAREVEPFIAAQDRKVDAFRTKAWAGRGPEGLLADLDRLNALHAEAQWTIVAVAMNMAVRSRFLKRMVRRSVPGATLGDVLKGYGRSGGLAPFEAMRTVAATARNLDRPLLERLAADGGADAAPTSAQLAASEPGRRLLGDFEAFMGRYGFLSANGSDFSEVPWIEEPGSIWRTVARLALRPDAAPSPDEAEAHREEVLGRVRAGLGPVRRRVFDRLHRSTVRFLGWRERISLLMSEDSYLMRRCSLALGRTLVDRGVLERPEDVFFLYADELREAVRDGAAEGPAAKVARRKAEMAADAAIDPPETISADGWNAPPRGPSPPEPGLDALHGVGGSAGVLRGRARIIQDPALDGHHLAREGVLVVPFTDIGWTPVLAEAGAIVAETGGQLSHTSIIAREFGIPAVVSVRNATSLIREGEDITVDGTAGRVYLHRGNKT
jgi:pyruvate,water dikinase